MIIEIPNNILDLKNCDIKETEYCYIIKYSERFLSNNFLYYTNQNSKIILSFNFLELCKYLIREKVSLNPNKNIIPFFSKFGYAPMDHTIIDEIKKLPNFCSLQINKLSYQISYSLENTILVNETGDDIQIIKDSIINNYSIREMNAVLFSGGLDSTVIAKVLKEKFDSKNIELVIGRYIGLDFIPNILDVKYSMQIADYLKLPLKIIDIDIDKVCYQNIEKIILNQPNTSHFSIVFQSINESYNNESVNFLSGQQADSILNFGSTSFVKIEKKGISGLGELARRILYLSNKQLLNSIFHLLNYKIPKHKRFPQLALYCGFKKLPYIKYLEEYKHLSQTYSTFLNMVDNPEAILNSNHLFYIFFHLSGSDASGILNNMCSTNNPLPFNNIELIKYYINKKYTFTDIIIPKKPIIDILKTDKELWKLLISKPSTPNISFDVVFNRIASRLNLKSEFDKNCKNLGLVNLDFCYNNYHLAKYLSHIYEI